MCFALILPGGTGRHRDSEGLGYGMLKPLEKWQESFCERSFSTKRGGGLHGSSPLLVTLCLHFT